MRKFDVTTTPKYVITDNRKVSLRSPVKKLTLVDPNIRSEIRNSSKSEPAKKVNSFSNFVSNYSRIHGINYKEALKSQEVKNLYKSFNRPQTGTQYFVKSSFEEKRPTYTPELRKVGDIIYLDPRHNENTFEPVDIKEVSNDQQRLQVSRGLYVDLKRSYLEYINSDPTYSSYFKKSSHTQENFKPLTDSITTSILENAIKNRILNIFSISPFLELSILNYSYSKYKTLLQQQKRTIIERYMSAEARIIATKLGSTSTRGASRYIKNSDTFFLNVSSSFYAADFLADIVTTKLAERQKNYDIIFTDSNRQIQTISDFFSTEFGEAIVDKLVRGTPSEKEEVLRILRDKNNGNFILQETTNDYLYDLTNALNSYAGDNRALLEKITEATKEKLTVYYNTEPVTELNRGDLFKSNPTSKKIYMFSRSEEIDSDTVNLYYINEKGSERKLQNSRSTDGFKLSNLRKVVVIPETAADSKTQEIPFEKLSETLPKEKLSDIFMVASGQDEKLSKLVRRKKKPLVLEEEVPEGEDQAGPSTVPELVVAEEGEIPEGEGLYNSMRVAGGSLSNNLNEFKNSFNPVFKLLGKSGVENVYKLSF